MRTDSRYPTRQRYDPRRMPSTPPPRRGITLPMAIVADVLAAALLLGVFYYTNYMVIPDVPDSSMSAPPTAATASPADPTATPLPHTPKPTSSGTKNSSSPSPSAAPTATAAPLPGAFRANFPDKFTTGQVIKNDMSYQSANVNISIKKDQYNGSVYYFADIYIADLKCFKSSFGATDKWGTRDFVDDTIKAVGGIIGIDGDNCVDNKGLIFRNGQKYLEYKSSCDVLVMYNDGTMKTIPADQYNMKTVKAENPYMVWNFGPMLLDNGQPMTKFTLPQTIGGKNNRSAIGYYEPGHYCFVVVEGRGVDNSPGLTCTEFSNLMYSLGCKAAYNFDGGGTSMMAFMGNKVSNPVSDYRKSFDTVYISDN